MKQIATTIGQSKRMEAAVRGTQSADFVWISAGIRDPKLKIKKDCPSDGNVVAPAWSMGAILEHFPKHIEIKYGETGEKTTYNLTLAFDEEKPYVGYYKDSWDDDDDEPYTLYETTADDPFEALVLMAEALAVDNEILYF